MEYAASPKKAAQKKQAAKRFKVGSDNQDGVIGRRELWMEAT
jgi:hypothetical protein